MVKAIEANSLLVNQLSALPITIISWRNSDWTCKLLTIACCLLGVLFVIASMITFTRICIYWTNSQYNDYMEDEMTPPTKIEAHQIGFAVSSGSKDELFVVDHINEVSKNDVRDAQKIQKHKRQATESPSTIGNTSTTSGVSAAPRNSSLVDIPQPIFFPQIVGNFQLALKSDQSIVVIIGNDQNIYLSKQSSSGTSPSTFSLVDLSLPNESYVGLIQDAQNRRYLHSYNDVQDKGYSRIRTHLDTYMPCNANIMFWTFANGYMQFYRGGKWFYDTAGCLDRSTGLVRIWIINGQQGLLALQAMHGTCALAPLAAINY